MERERGSAAIILTLENGELIAYNENHKRILHKRKMFLGEWNELWAFITKDKKRSKNA
tara:strand:+ start:547 stop:720 length:174 start_codon:yes stop_codon:yes gene_type:complete